MKTAALAFVITFTVVLSASVHWIFAIIGFAILAMFASYEIWAMQQAGRIDEDERKLKMREALARTHVRVITEEVHD